MTVLKYILMRLLTYVLLPVFMLMAMLFGPLGSEELRSREQTEQVFLKYQEEYQTAAAQALEQGSADHVGLPRGTQHITLGTIGGSEDRYVEFYTGGAGFGPSTSDWGVVYTTGDEPVGFQGMRADGVWDGGGWLWEEADGDNWSYITELDEHWYAYEMHF